MTDGSTPAGWYPDPAARFDLRFWDGVAWTDHVSRGGIAAVDALGDGGPARRGAWTYLWWLLVGATVTLGMLTILTIGVFLLLAGTALAVIGALVPRIRSGHVGGAIAGAAAPVLYIAWLNRHGPGEYCRAFADGGYGCEDQGNPWLWLAAANVLTGLSIGATVLLRRP